MRVSVVIPCYNSLRWLPDTLDSVLAQTFTDLEVVLVDDGGSDGLEAWAAGRGDGRVRVVRQDNAGVSAARNRGITSARGELIAFCDSDDLWDPAALERLVGRFDDDPAVGLVYGWYDVIDGEGRPSGRVEAFGCEGEAWESFVTTNPVAMSASLVPAPVFARLGGFDVNRDKFPIDVEDWEMWIRIAASFPVAVVREVVCHHRRHDSNSSTNVASLEAAYRHLIAKVFADEGPSRLTMRAVALGRIEVILAWHSLNDDGDAAKAAGYRRSALRHHPELRRNPEYWRLGAALLALTVLGGRGYSAVRSAAWAGRRRFNTGVRGTGS